MQYKEARDFIASLAPRGIAPGLSNISALCSALGDPQDKSKIIHIAGTNGKGSVGAFLESILMCCGKSVGRFSSPAVNDHLEMFTMNGAPVSESDYAECVSRIAEQVRALASNGIYITSFEAETAAAFLLFEKLKPDYVLLECGMGGRLDSTNIISRPALSVITSVSIDHTAFLGETITDIAREKAGIIKAGVPVVAAEQTQDALEVIKSAAASLGSELYIADTPQNTEYRGAETTFDLGDTKSLSIQMSGTYQPKNAAVVAKAAEVLGVPENMIRLGLRSARWKYRFMRIGNFILDGAHNPSAAAELKASAPLYLSGKAALICGVFRDKDYRSIAKLTAGIGDIVYTVTPPGERGLPSETLACEFRKHGMTASACSSLADAISSARDHDSILIFGSLSILAEAERIIKRGTQNGAMP